jgi:LDH2 family malate/lactate/ureidoglycolate dehydrogenase
LGGGEHFLNEAGHLARFVRDTPTAAGAPTITLPGDPERLMRQKREVEGIVIPQGTWDLLVKLAVELQVAV